MKKILALVACLSLVASLAVGGSIAYLQDQKSTVNVMTLGNVKIDLIEQERVKGADGNYEKNADGTTKLQTYVNKPLYPAVFTGTSIPWAPETEWVVPGDPAWRVAEKNANVVDKFVTVKNSGKSEAYIRTLIAYEGDETYGPEGDYIHIVALPGNENAYTQNFVGYITVDEVKYTVYEYVYSAAIAPGVTTVPSLKQIYMNYAADNDVVSHYGDTYDVLVLAQAVQAAGFENAATALETAFPKGTDNANVAGWFKEDVEQPTIVNTAAELQAAVDGAVEGKENVVVFGADITGDVKVTQKPNTNVTIDGGTHKFNGMMTVFGGGNQSGAETLTIKNINFVAKAGADSCIVSPDKTKQTPATYSYSHNVTVENCTFTDPEHLNETEDKRECAAIRHEDGGDQNWVVKGCTVDSTMHSLLQVNNVVGKLTVDDCEVKSKNGANLNSCTNVEMTGCNFDVNGYAARFGQNKGDPASTKTYVIKDSTLTSAKEAVIVFRGDATNDKVTLTLQDTTISGPSEFEGNANVNIVR